MTITDVAVPSTDELEDMLGDRDDFLCAHVECDDAAQQVVVFTDGTHAHTCDIHTLQLIIIARCIQGTLPMPCPLPHTRERVYRSSRDLAGE